MEYFINLIQLAGWSIFSVILGLAIVVPMIRIAYWVEHKRKKHKVKLIDFTEGIKFSWK